jgi:hypothetical protein
MALQALLAVDLDAAAEGPERLGERLEHARDALEMAAPAGLVHQPLERALGLGLALAGKGKKVSGWHEAEHSTTIARSEKAAKSGGTTVQRALNLKNFMMFARQVKGARLTEISVARDASGKGVRLKYTARDPKTRKLFIGEWVVSREAPAAGGKAPPDEEAAEKEFYSLAEKEFAVRRQTPD